jgi:hypothetical protein
LRLSFRSLLMDTIFFTAIIILVSCIPVLFLPGDVSFTQQIQSVLYDVLKPASVKFPSSSWTREPFLLIPSQWSEGSDKEVLFPLFPYIIGPYSVTFCSFLFSLILGFLLTIWVAKFFRYSPNFAAHILYIIKWIPTSFVTAFLQCTLIFSLCKMHRIISFPYISTVVIVISASVVFVTEAVKGWIPFHLTVPPSIPTGKSLFFFFLSARKAILFPMLITISFLEFLLHTDGLINFLLSYYLISPSVEVIGITMLYIPYFFFLAAQAVIAHQKKQFSYRLQQDSSLQSGADA